MTRPTQQPDTVTLEQAWHFLMVQLAFRNPLLVKQAQMARQALRDIKRHRRGSL